MYKKTVQFSDTSTEVHVYPDENGNEWVRLTFESTWVINKTQHRTYRAGDIQIVTNKLVPGQKAPDMLVAAGADGSFIVSIQKLALVRDNYDDGWLDEEQDRLLDGIAADLNFDMDNLVTSSINVGSDSAKDDALMTIAEQNIVHAEQPAEEENNTKVLWETITNALPKSPDEAINGFWFNELDQEIICMGSVEDREKAANFLEAVLRVPILTGDYAELDGTEGVGHYITID